MSRRAYEGRLRLLLVVASTLCMLGLCEVAARVVPGRGPAGLAGGTPISETSPTLGWRARPNGSQRIRRADFAVTVSINGRGMRGPVVPLTAGSGVRRLAVMGDSFAHGYYAEEPDTLRGRLAATLTACRVEVLNAGQPGYSTDQEWIYFNEDVRNYRPVEVILLFYYNDLHFNLESVGTANREKPMFVERNGSLELRPPAPKGDPTEEDARSTSAGGGPRFRHSALWAFLAGRLQRSRPDWSRTLSAYGLVPELSTEPPAEYLPFGPKDPGERSRVELMWQRTTEILRRFRDDVRSTGAGFSVFYVPARFEVNDEAWAFVQRRYEPDRSWIRDAVRTRLASALKALDIPLVEAGALFETAERTGKPAYLPVDGHWNARGNEIAFDALFPVMRRAFSCGS